MDMIVLYAAVLPSWAYAMLGRRHVSLLAAGVVCGVVWIVLADSMTRTISGWILVGIYAGLIVLHLGRERKQRTTDAESHAAR